VHNIVENVHYTYARIMASMNFMEYNERDCNSCENSHSWVG